MVGRAFSEGVCDSGGLEPCLLLPCMSLRCACCRFLYFFFQAEDGIRDLTVTGVQTCALPIVSGPSSVGIGGTITLYAAVGDANGNPIPNPSVTWTSSDSSIAQVVGVSDTATVTGSQPGYATITATSGGLSGSLTIQVVGSPLPVATVTVVPDTASLVVGQDSVSFRAELRDSTGRVTTERPVSWSTTDSTVIYIQPSYGGIQTFVRGLAAGRVVLRASSEGKTGPAAGPGHLV